MFEYHRRGELALKKLLEEAEIVRQWLTDNNAPKEILELFEKTRKRSVIYA